jgi:hypothetical protein
MLVISEDSAGARYTPQTRARMRGRDMLSSGKHRGSTRMLGRTCGMVRMRPLRLTNTMIPFGREYAATLSAERRR